MSFKLVEGGLCRNGLHVITPENLAPAAGGKKWTCRECYRAASRRNQRRYRQRESYARTSPEERRDRTLRKYGLTLDAYAAMLEAQGGACAICGATEPGGRWNTHFAIDHCHASGRVRGLLCGHCNVMLGNAQDDPARLREAAAYLEARI